MPIVKKNKKTVTTATAPDLPAVKKAAPVAKKREVEEEEVKVVKKAAPVAKKAAPVAEKKTATGGKKSLTAPKAPKSFEIKEGGQATQEAFLDKYYKKIQDLGYTVTKEEAKALKRAYSETLREVTEIASYQDVDAQIYYARRYIKPRVTEPPKAKDGLKTFMAGHYELKVRKLLGNEEDFKYFGELSEDGTTFVTTDGDEIPVIEDEAPKKTTAKKTVKKAIKKVEPVEDEEVEEEEVGEEEDADFTEDDASDLFENEEEEE